jgi:carboxyl-terminal processing protease
MNRTLLARGRIVLAVALLMVVSLLVPAAMQGEITKPRSRDRSVSKVVQKLLSREHLTAKPLDDEVAGRALQLYLQQLDPRRLYFVQTDVDEFRSQQDMLDDGLREGNIEFAYLVLKRFLERLDERMEWINELVGVEFDFAVEEWLETAEDTYATNDEEARQRWRKAIKHELLNLKVDGVEGEEASRRVKNRYQKFARRMHSVSQDELLEMYLSAFAGSMDPRSRFLSPAALREYHIQTGLALEGIGAALQATEGRFQVTKIIRGSAADLHGKLKPGDRIVGVGQGESEEIVDVTDLKLLQLVNLIRGRSGTTVRLRVIPDGSDAAVTYQIKRGNIRLIDSEAHSAVFGRDPKIGVISLPSIYIDHESARNGAAEFKSATRDVRRLLKSLKQQQVDAILLDLRQCDGNSLNEAINLASLFLDAGPVTQSKDSTGRVQVYDDVFQGTEWDGPLVLVTSRITAGAPEFLAAAIQDYRRGIVVGDESTNGKGTEQQLIELGRHLFRIPDPPNLGALALTSRMVYRPTGASIQRRGVVSDIVLPSLTNDIVECEEDREHALVGDAVEACAFKQLDLVNDELVQKLQAASQARVAASEEFAELSENIARVRARQLQTLIPLKEATFREQWRAQDEDPPAPTPGGSPKNTEYFFEELLAITRDYVKALSKN